ncbi:hypothetical protein L207DRAFT_532614 [Hyaloscypha variabilis F]|uniref:Uncharacterized protein n=1 Tax=Hyaloscypha variabilis (strain UAMH 11265 / GT02V1 / F) TaxID=1149755 RepID=A0A2J6REV4_HYAVF|nr:hypothetical protein L207DRAFT_532614 [Hyaloscypha variabilis F]
MWLEDDLQVLDDVRELKHVFKTVYNFKTHLCIIHSRQPYQHMEAEISQLHETQLSKSRRNPYKPIPGLRWSSLRSQLERNPANVLVLRDCCEAGGSLDDASPLLTSSVNTDKPPISKAGTTELIAASPFDTLAPGPSERSFTCALITELKTLAQEGQLFSVAELHRRVLANIIKQRTGVKSRILKQWLHPSVSPVYVRLVGDTAAPSIGLMPISVESGMKYPEKSSECRHQKERQALEQEREEAEPIEGAEFRGHGSGDLVTFCIEERAGNSLPEPYWRTREYEEKKSLDIEGRNERLWAIGWKTGSSRAKVTAMTEPQHESPEIMAWGQDRVEDGLAGVLKWFTDLILRVPRVESCGL